ncbi:MAG: hypothetical protein IJK98_05530, partial [Clostridia bacterium]|nr:hypothetical protein [Clostridia bacterium]
MYIIPIYNVTVLPDGLTYLRADAFRKSTGQAAEQGDKVILLPAKTDNSGPVSADDFYDLAVTGVIGSPDTNGYVEIRTQDRVKVDAAEVLDDGRIQLSVSLFAGTDDLPEAEAKARCAALKEELLSFSKKFEWAPVAKYLLSFCENLNALITVLSPFMEME